MTLDAPARSTAREGTAFRSFLAVVVPPFLLSLAVSVCLYVGGGPGLTLYIGGISLVMVLTPPLVVAERARVEQLLVIASLVDGVGLVWLIAMFRSDLTFGQWLAAYVTVATCAIAAAGIVLVLSRYVMHHLFAAAVTVVASLLWLTWPIWLSALIDSRTVVRAMHWLVPVHPLLALNGLLANLGVWGEWPLMYQITSLGQDVPYRLPSSVAWCALMHFLLGGALLLACRGGERGAPVDEPDRSAG